MTNPLPGDPEPENPKFGNLWLKSAQETLAWDGSAWVPYEDVPPWPGAGDPDPWGFIRGDDPDDDSR